jgi:uracil-DNA glycosylase
MPAAPIGQVMVIGHNFDTLTGFQRSLERGAENFRIPTWRHLLALLDAVGLAPERCFFTNAYMGLIDGPSNVGRFPGAADPAFVERCTAFLAEQLTVMQPRLVLTLGGAVLPMVARLAGPIAGPWRTATSAAALDACNAALLTPVWLAGVPHPTTLVALTHPAQRPLNVGRRRYRRLVGDAAERALLREALAQLEQPAPR